MIIEINFYMVFLEYSQQVYMYMYIQAVVYCAHVC